MIKAFEHLMHRETWRQTALRLQRENDVLLLRSRRAIADRDRLAALLAQALGQPPLGRNGADTWSHANNGPIEGCVGGPHVRGSQVSCSYCVEAIADYVDRRREA